ncbi:hypothetical protein OGM63_05685 [Plectonema radiosum NIES-515]|uniref:Uncharacterized protein n=1 Tax=Plectonema radiosum NIES-515 TaxID=2986073 RepID=A0ABT3AV70_9CYAN|nr:hypothetical protein [Plectonema radiosum]MCV3213022.1 hypothetical protein [Plectonema radiosum NIES-515]
MINNVAGLISSSSVSSFSKSINSKVNLTPNTPVGILNSNSKRKYAAFINNSQVDITLVLEDKSKAIIDEGIVIKGYGGSYEITLLNLYTGKVSAISAAITHLSFVEGFE